ncbi:unnamed protein product [Pedinophyceae sp. YPF-701]|nr:unnamed protein product [Pedinophyceae sp. YPF-701]
MGGRRLQQVIARACTGLVRGAAEASRAGAGTSAAAEPPCVRRWVCTTAQLRSQNPSDRRGTRDKKHRRQGKPEPIHTPTVDEQEGAAEADPPQEAFFHRFEDDDAYDVPRPVLSTRRVSAMSAEDIGTYFKVDAATFPEGLARGVLQEFQATGDLGPRKGAEDDKESGRAQHGHGHGHAPGGHLMLRSVTQRAIDRLKGVSSGAGGVSIFLDGMQGSGKSCVLASCVQWAREKEWITWNVPDAAVMTEGGRFHKHEGSGLFDTPNAAQAMMQGLLDANGDLLKEVKCAKASEHGHGTLHDIVLAGASLTGEATGAVDLCLAALDEISHQDQKEVLIAIDNYSALYFLTGFGEWTSIKARRPIAPHELRLGQAMRLLEGKPPKRGAVVAATHKGGRVTPKLNIPHPQRSRVEVPRMSRDEAVSALFRYLQSGAIDPPQQPSAGELDLMNALTCGNWAEFRFHVPAWRLWASRVGPEGEVVAFDHRGRSL